MATNYTPSDPNSFDPTISIPEDVVDPVDAASVANGFQQLADNCFKLESDPVVIEAYFSSSVNVGAGLYMEMTQTYGYPSPDGVNFTVGPDGGTRITFDDPGVWLVEAEVPVSNNSTTFTSTCGIIAFSVDAGGGQTILKNINNRRESTDDTLPVVVSVPRFIFAVTDTVNDGLQFKITSSDGSPSITATPTSQSIILRRIAQL